jgi:beta-carotene hydroxylase
MNTSSTPLPKLHEIGRDLLETTSKRRFWVLFRPFFFLALFALVSVFANPIWGFPLLVAMFIANICAAHDVVHNSLRLKNSSTHILISIYGSLVMQSGHAFRITHLAHHAMFPSPKDPEGAASYGTVLHALWMGPTYVPKLWWWAFKRAKRQPIERMWMVFEAIFAAAVIAFAILMLPYSAAPIVYVVVMTLGSWLYPLITAYLPHNHPGEDEVHQSRSIHGKILPYLLLGLNYHLEHHLYPRVPAHHLGTLSKRLLPYFEEHEAHIIQVP